MAYRGPERRRKPRPWYTRKRLWVTGLAVIALLAIAIYSLTSDTEDLLRLVERLRAHGKHWWSPVALVLAMVVVNLVGLPGTPLTIASGAVWGWWLGAIWMMVATMVGTSIPYFLARRHMGGVREKMAARHPRTLKWIRQSGFTAVAVLRLVPAFPYAVTSYGSGLAGVRARDYFAGTFVGSIPGVLVWAYSADSILKGMSSPEEASRRILTAALILAVFVVTTTFLARWIRKRSEGA